jgi:hypothetical protein
MRAGQGVEKAITAERSSHRRLDLQYLTGATLMLDGGHVMLR